MSLSHFVSTAWLADNLQNPDVVIFDVSWYRDDTNDTEKYEKAHIPGAQHLPFFAHAPKTDFLPNNIPPAPAWQQQLRDAGVSRDSHVVVYESCGNCGLYVGCRAVWTFKLFGHDKVSVLDGGWEKWVADGLPTTADPPKPRPAGDISATYRASLRTEFAAMERIVAEPGDVQVVDSRPRHMYAAGHLPGAISLPYGDFLDRDRGCMKSMEDIKAALLCAGVDLSRPVVSTCNSGMSASFMLLAALASGAHTVSNYHGSIIEWRQRRPDKVVVESQQ